MSKFQIEILVTKRDFCWEEGDEGYTVYLDLEDYELLEDLVKNGDYENIKEAIRGVISFTLTHYRTHNHLDFS